MIKTFTVKNFRCIPDLTLTDLGAVNIIVGNNGAGKTALLESIFLCQAGLPEFVLRLRMFRGLGNTVLINQTRSSYEAVWRDLFFQMDQSRAIELTATGNVAQTRSLSIYYDPKENPLPISANGHESALQKADSSAVTPITFRYRLPSNEEHAFKPVFKQGSVQNAGPLLPPTLTSFYCSSFATVVPQSEVAQQFSELNKRNKATEFVATMRALYPQILDFSVETDAGGAVYLYCSVDGVEERIPIALASTGSHKLAAILLGIAENPEGVILIDEIENGFYYDKMPDVWKAILAFSRRFNTQILVTTHSKECLVAALPTIEQNPIAFRLIRMERQDGKSAAKVFRGADFAAAIETDTEVR